MLIICIGKSTFAYKVCVVAEKSGQKRGTFWLRDDELHFLGAVMYDLCCLTEGDAFQADIVQGDQATTCRQTSQWNTAGIFRKAHMDF